MSIELPIERLAMASVRRRLEYKNPNTRVPQVDGYSKE